MWPNLSSVNKKIYDTITGIDNKAASNLNVWVRLFSGVSSGLILVSNPNRKLFAAAGESGVYGSMDTAGTLGIDWNGNAINPNTGRGYRPSPIVKSLEFKEGEDQISRSGTITITAFSLEQMEGIQKYFMEPGYTLFVEWGWNTENGAKGMIDTSDSKKIPSLASSGNLIQSSIRSKKIKTLGEYDSFLGFIVGGSVASSGEEFNITIELRGTPELPSYLQSHDVIYKANSAGNVIAEQKSSLFSVDSTKKEAAKGEDKHSVARNRRFNRMYNELPAKRQITGVKNLQSKFKHTDFINFDNVVSKSINSYQKKSMLWGLYEYGKATETQTVKTESGKSKDFEIEREKLFSPHSYIRFEKVIEILNQNGGFESFNVGGKSLKTSIDISNSIIGAFPLIYSTKPETLIIPGKIPNFSKLFLNEGSLNYGNVESIDNDIDGISFVQYFKTPKGFKNKESDGYWGYLKNLYINFDLFEEKLTGKNKTIKDVLLDILNELSSAVNSFWNFEIVETEDDVNDTIRFGVVDRNFVGKPNGTVRTFHHNGTKSKFLQASLDIDIPAEAANKIIGNRLNIKTQADHPYLGSTFFSKSPDRFLSGKTFKGRTDIDDPDTTPPDGSVEALEREKEDTTAEFEQNLSNLGTPSAVFIQGKGNLYFKPVLDSNNNVIGRQFYADDTYSTKTDTYLHSNKKAAQKLIELQNKAKELEEQIDKSKLNEKLSNLEGNLSKIELLPNPMEVDELTLNDDLSEITNTDTFNKNFRIYCYKDTNLFDILKNQKMSKTDGTRLSHPLPIKYNFTILGNSGLRRGDMFNIIGIPDKYRNNGLFQINSITHSIENMIWQTQIEGLYRQSQ